MAMTEAEVSFDGMATTMTCSFDANNATDRCEMAMMGETFSVTTAYDSVADFIEEGSATGLVKAKTETVNEPGTEPKVETYTYDGQGQLLRSVEDRSEGVLTTDYSNYDEKGRPLQAVLSFINCDGLPIELAYDDVGRTMSTTFLPDVGSDCGFSERTDVDTFDEHGNFIKAEEGGSDPRIVFSATVVSTEEVCD